MRFTVPGRIGAQGQVLADLTEADITPVIDRIAAATDTGGGDNNGHIVAAVAADGVSLEITDTVGGGDVLVVIG